MHFLLEKVDFQPSLYRCEGVGLFRLSVHPIHSASHTKYQSKIIKQRKVTKPNPGTSNYQHAHLMTFQHIWPETKNMWKLFILIGYAKTSPSPWISKQPNAPGSPSPSSPATLNVFKHKTYQQKIRPDNGFVVDLANIPKGKIYSNFNIVK